MFSCRTKLEKFECLNMRGMTEVLNALTSCTDEFQGTAVHVDEADLDDEAIARDTPCDDIRKHLVFEYPSC